MTFYFSWNDKNKLKSVLQCPVLFNKIKCVCPTYGQNYPYLNICLGSLDTVLEWPEPRFQCPAGVVRSVHIKQPVK